MSAECDVVNAGRRCRSRSWQWITSWRRLATHSSSRTSCTVVHCLSSRSAAARSCVRRSQPLQQVDVDDAKCRSLQISSYWLAELLPTWLTTRRKTHRLTMLLGAVVHFVTDVVVVFIQQRVTTCLETLEIITCQENVGKLTKSQGNILSGKTVYCLVAK